jgi:ribonuclease HI
VTRLLPQKSINTDAGVARDGSGGAVATVARSDAGVFLGASALFIQSLTEPETLEAMAVREGINLALDLSLPKIKVATDCLTMVKALKENLRVYTHIIQERK